MKAFESCPFCEEKIKRSTFAESENFRAILNIAPVLPGHSLVIPKKHITGLMELADEDLFEMIRLSRKAIDMLRKVFQTEAFDWTIQEKPEAGQTIEHLHLHIIPRFKNDLPDPGDWYPLVKENDPGIIDSELRRKLSDEEMDRIRKRLTDAGKLK